MKATCKVETCVEPVFVKGLCKPHDARVRRHGDVQAHIPLRKYPRGTPSVCRIPKCDDRPVALELCAVHYARKQRTGTTYLLARPPKPRKPCAVETCDDFAKAHGYCGGHYSRIKKTGDARPHEPLKRTRHHKGATCADATCARRAVAVGMCAIHRLKTRSAADPEIVRTYSAKQRAMRKQAPTVPFSSEALAAKVAYWGNRCWMCHGPYEAADHVKPLTKGGWHILSNLRPACTSCNSRKGRKWPFPTSAIAA